MEGDVCEHLPHLGIRAAVLGTLERSDGRRIGRVGIGAGAREHAGGESGVVPTAMLGVEHEHDVQK